MLFALADFLRYKRKSGRYGPSQNGPMGLAQVGYLSDETVAELGPGDLIFTQQLDRNLSWALMYMTSSDVDHIAMYAGDKKVIHMTVAGARLHPLRVFGKNCRLLPVRLAPTESADPLGPGPNYVTTLPSSRLSQRLPPKAELAWIAFRIVLGLHPDRFRWRFLADIAMLAAIIDMAMYIGLGVIAAIPVAALMATFAAAATVVFAIRKKLGHRPSVLSHPDVALGGFTRNGGLIFSSAGTIVCCEVGLLPLAAFLALSRKGTEDSTPDELQDIRKRVRNIAERWHIAKALDAAENEQGDQYDQKKMEESANNPGEVHE